MRAWRTGRVGAQMFPRPANTMRRSALAPVSAENGVTSCDLQVLMDDAAESVSSAHADARP